MLSNFTNDSITQRWEPLLKFACSKFTDTSMDATDNLEYYAQKGSQYYEMQF